MNGHNHSASAEIGGPFATRLRRLTHIGDDELCELQRLSGEARQIHAKTDLVHASDHPVRLHVLLEGWACRYKLLRDGRRQITSLLLPGEICDLDTLYVTNSDYAVGALTACTVAPIDRSELRDLATSQPAIGEALGVLMALDNAMLTERSACLGRRSAREHVSHLLCELLVRLMLVGHARGNGFTLLITQEEIADTLGLTAVHVNRVLQGLKSDGLIEQRGHNVVISEWGLLRRIAGFQSGYLHLEDVDEATFDFVRVPWVMQTQSSDQNSLDAHG